MTTAYENPSEDPLTIGILIPRLGGGGAEFVALQWAVHLRDQGHQVVVITTHGGSETHDQLTVTALRAGSFLARVSELRRHVAAGGYDVLLSLMPHWNVLALLATTGLAPRPAVVISGRNIETTLRTTQSTMYQLELMMSRVLYPRADGYVAISHPVAAEAASRYRLPIERIWVVPNPATGKTQDLVPRRASELRTVTLTVPARLVRQKRPELAVETAAILRDRYGVRPRSSISGTVPRSEPSASWPSAMGSQVDFRGWVTAWFSEVAADAVVLLPSTAEGFGNVLVEAAAAGVPSVTSSRALGTARRRGTRHHRHLGHGLGTFGLRRRRHRGHAAGPGAGHSVAARVLPGGQRRPPAGRVALRRGPATSRPPRRRTRCPGGGPSLARRGRSPPGAARCRRLRRSVVVGLALGFGTAAALSTPGAVGGSLRRPVLILFLLPVWSLPSVALLAFALLPVGYLSVVPRDLGRFLSPALVVMAIFLLRSAIAGRRVPDQDAMAGVGPAPRTGRVGPHRHQPAPESVVGGDLRGRCADPDPDRQPDR